MTRDPYNHQQIVYFNQSPTLESGDHRLNTNEKSLKTSHHYHQSDLNSNRKVLFDQNDFDRDCHQVDWDRPNQGTLLRGVSPEVRESEVYAGIQDQGSQLENFESFSKNYLTFKNVQKENQPPRSDYMMADTLRSASKDKGKPRQEQLTTRNNYADRYLMMMKNRRKSTQPRQDSQNKSGRKKSSVFDEIRHQAVNRVHSRHF